MVNKILALSSKSIIKVVNSPDFVVAETLLLCLIDKDCANLLMISQRRIPRHVFAKLCRSYDQNIKYAIGSLQGARDAIPMHSKVLEEKK